MRETSFDAKLINFTTIRVAIFSMQAKPENMKIRIVKNDFEINYLQILKTSNMLGLSIYECKTPYPIELGNKYEVQIDSLGIVPLFVDDVSLNDDFDEKYTYEGDDLGANYNDKFTEFVLWAPLASNVLLKIRKNEDNDSYYEMIREPKGIFRLKLDGNWDGAIYTYLVQNSGVVRETSDPYAKGSTPNGRNSVVINFKRCRIDLENDVSPTYNSYTDAVVYELHVRDMTISPYTNIKNKGKFLGLAEEKRQTLKGNPAGLDYLKYLGVTHVQILPMFDYQTVDELNSDNQYNWGYDPQQYFVPEGSYASDVNDPYSRIIDLKKMIKALHHNKIKVIMDVVFNHVYDAGFCSFEKTVPNYYFRRKSNGLMSAGSCCGNDVASERTMVSKMIYDACIYWIKEFGIDGFRFDLMGLTDKHTINRIYREAISIKKDFIIYGEGWNMQTSLPDEDKTCLNNALNLPQIGFFNDMFRDILKGSTSEYNFYQKGYLTGDLSYIEGFKFSFMGSCINYCYNRRFVSANQSINYVECHDNGVLYDKICACKGISEYNKIKRVIKVINATVLLSYGIPFFHSGQEIGQSKNMHQNTYKSGDKYNMFRYDLLDQRFDMANYFKSIISFRKRAEFLKVFQSEKIEEIVSFENLNNGGIKIVYNLEKFQGTSKFKKLYLFINPADNEVYYSSEHYLRVLISDVGYAEMETLNTKNLVISPNTLILYGEVEQ